MNNRLFKATSRILLASLLSTPLFSVAEDTDIYSNNPAVAGTTPNVLIIVDNTANWNTVFSAEKSALVSLFDTLDDNFNVGVEFFANSNDKESTAVSTSAIEKGAYIRAAVRPMTTGTTGNTTKYAALINALTSSNGNGGDGGDAPYYGLAMAEAYRYFSGGSQFAGAGYRLRDYTNNPNNTSGNTANSTVHAVSGNALSSSTDTTYESPISDSCQKNYIIFISNGQSNLNENSGNTVKNLLSAAGGSTSQIGLSPNHFEGSYADEWARFMANTDIHSLAGKQTVVTYTLDVNPSTTGNGPDNTALLQSMASVGEGKYFSTDGTQTAIEEALDDIFTEINAKNSVFASSTLPVSVNLKGSYLNQVYMGVFRPDAHANPRWPGNLKQYKLGLDGDGSLQLQDRDGVAAAGTSSDGFISPTATSFWSTASNFWDEAYYGEMGDGATSDAPDGDLVEKGGVAYRSRTLYATSQAARNVYTCSGTCSTGSLLSNTPFLPTNTDLTDSLFQITAGQSVSSLTRTANSTTDYTVTATVNNHGYSTGNNVTIAGANQSAYNGTYPITVTGTNTFTYSITVSPTSPATGTLLAVKPGATATITNISYDGTTATATAAGHTFLNGDLISISGTGVSAFNNTFTISGVVAGTSFQFPASQQPTTPGGGGTAKVGSNTKNIESSTANPTAGIVRTGTNVVVKTTANHGFGSNGSSISVTITGATPSEYNGTWTATIQSNKTFSFTITTTPATGSNTSGSFTATRAAGSSVSLSSLTRSGTTVTANTGSTNMSLNAGDTVSVSGANETGYNGTVTVVSVDNSNTSSRKFTYTISTTPASPATGTITSNTGGASSKNDLINWIRGQNVLIDDNPDENSTHVRGYLHGDVVHSRPLVVNYNRDGSDDGTDIVVFYGANDGMLHTVKGGRDDNDGYEMWSFIPTEFMSGLDRLYENSPSISTSSTKPYFFDGPVGMYQEDAYADGQIVAGDVDSSTGLEDKLYIYPAARRGGRLVYALDVTDPDAPKLLWKKTNASTGFSELGYTWSEPKAVKIRAHSNPVLIFGAGYDPVAEDASTQGTATMGRGIFIVDAYDGSIVKTFGPTDGLTYPVPGDVVALNTDFDADDYVDRLYFTDTGGHVWRVNIDDASTSNWVLKMLGSVDGGRKFLYAPDVVYNTTYDAVLVGSGDREHPFETATTNRFYMFKDNKGTSAVPPDPDNGGDGIEEADLCDATNYHTDSSVVTCLANTSKYGWYYTLGTGEKVVTGATTQNQAVTFGTNIPSSIVNTAGYCGSTLGEARIYVLDARTAASVIDMNGDGVIDEEDAYTEYAGGGLPPTPVPVVVEVDGELKEGVITGPTVLEPPGLEYNQRYRSYWYFEGDQ